MATNTTTNRRAARKAAPRNLAKKSPAKTVATRKPAKAKRPRTISSTPPPAGSKAHAVIDAMREPNGVTTAKVVAMTGWRPHTLRAFISQKVRGAMGLRVETKAERKGQTTYRILADAE